MDTSYWFAAGCGMAADVLVRDWSKSLWIAAALAALGCTETRGSAWVATPLGPDDTAVFPLRKDSGYRRDMRSRTLGDSQRPATSSIESEGLDKPLPEGVRPLGKFHNTYYSFPLESDYGGEPVGLFDASCKQVAQVARDFHDRVCVQGSGRLNDGRTVSFARRDCSCARECPRTGQRICYDVLDAGRYPWGRGATGRPITPFRTVAVDSSVIPLGSSLYIPAYAGLPIPGGGTHDGCFRAEDRGLKVVGQRIDVYAGSERSLREWNQAVPTAQGVDVFKGDGPCGSGSPIRPAQ